MDGSGGFESRRLERQSGSAGEEQTEKLTRKSLGRRSSPLLRPAAHSVGSGEVRA